MPTENEKNYLDKEPDREKSSTPFSNLHRILFALDLFITSLNLFGNILFAVFMTIPVSMLLYPLESMITPKNKNDTESKKP